MSQKMIQVIAVLALILCFGGLVFFRSAEAIPFALGVLLSCMLNAVKVILLERMVRKLSASAASYQTYRVYVQFLLRFLLTAGTLLLAVFVPFISLLGAICGIFTLPLSAFAMKFFPNAE